VIFGEGSSTQQQAPSKKYESTGRAIFEMKKKRKQER
jgi:hypothetical protein